jgi:hypothetical protein
VAAIKNELEGTGKDNGDSKVGPAVLREPKVFDRNPTLEAAGFAFIESLPSIPTPDTAASPLRRAKNLVRLLADDASGRALLADADARLTKILNARMDGLAAEHAEAVAANVADIKTVAVHTATVTIAGQDAGGTSRIFAGHIYSDAEGRFPADLNDWEERVVSTGSVALPSSRGIATRPGQVRTRCGSRTKPTQASGHRSKSTSSSSPSGTMAGLAQPSSIRTETISRMQRPSSARSRITPRPMGTGSCALSPSPR